MLKQIISQTDPKLIHIKDDPVRPHLGITNRVVNNKKVFYLEELDEVKAMVCVAFTDAVATTELELDRYISLAGTSVCMFYTIWSYAPGAGRELAMMLVDLIKKEYENITRIVTLSPKTDMARRFHLKNGAFELQVNADTVNFEYPLDK